MRHFFAKNSKTIKKYRKTIKRFGSFKNYGLLCTENRLTKMKRVRILCSLLLISLFVGIFQEAGLSFWQGFNLGYSISDYALESGLESNVFTMLDVQPKATQVVPTHSNLKDGAPVAVVPSSVSVSVFYPQGELPKTTLEKSIEVFGTVLNFVVIGVFIYLMVLLAKIILSFRRGHFFDDRNIHRINIIGIGFLALGAMNTLWAALNVYLAKLAVSLVDYDFSYAKVVDWDYIIIGFVILVMNEVLRLATKMKREQDLTI